MEKFKVTPQAGVNMQTATVEATRYGWDEHFVTFYVRSGQTEKAVASFRSSAVLSVQQTKEEAG